MHVAPGREETAPAAAALVGLRIDRWLVSRGRKEDGMAILARYHANGDVNDELVQDEPQNHANG
jgi:hypothetical protein